MMTDDQRAELVKWSLAMRERAYAPYSRFHVGAAVLASSGRIYTGANVENASYGAGVCAERNAIAAAVNAGERRILAVAVAGGRAGEEPGSHCFPCGICRQVMREFAEPDQLQVVVAKTEDDFRVFTLAELLPESFGPASL